MKHWSDFLETKSHIVKRMGKIASSLSFEVQDKENQLQNAKLNLDRFDIQICNKIAGNYSSESEFENAILCAKHKAEIWNNEPITTHHPHTIKNK